MASKSSSEDLRYWSGSGTTPVIDPATGRRGGRDPGVVLEAQASAD